MTALGAMTSTVLLNKQVQISNEKEMGKDILGCQTLEPFSECYHCPNNAYLIALENLIWVFIIFHPIISQ